MMIAGLHATIVTYINLFTTYSEPKLISLPNKQVYYNLIEDKNPPHLIMTAVTFKSVGAHLFFTPAAFDKKLIVPIPLDW